MRDRDVQRDSLPYEHLPLGDDPPPLLFVPRVRRRHILLRPPVLGRKRLRLEAVGGVALGRDAEPEAVREAGRPVVGRRSGRHQGHDRLLRPRQQLRLGRRRVHVVLASDEVRLARSLHPRRGAVQHRPDRRVQRGQPEPPREGGEDRPRRRRRAPVRHLRRGRRGVHCRREGHEHLHHRREQRVEVDGRRQFHEALHVHRDASRVVALLRGRHLLLRHGREQIHEKRLGESRRGHLGPHLSRARPAGADCRDGLGGVRGRGRGADRNRVVQPRVRAVHQRDAQGLGRRMRRVLAVRQEDAFVHAAELECPAVRRVLR